MQAPISRIPPGAEIRRSDALSRGNTPLVARRQMLQRGADEIEWYLM